MYAKSGHQKQEQSSLLGRLLNGNVLAIQGTQGMGQVYLCSIWLICGEVVPESYLIHTWILEFMVVSWSTQSIYSLLQSMQGYYNAYIQGDCMLLVVNTNSTCQLANRFYVLDFLWSPYEVLQGQIYLLWSVRHNTLQLCVGYLGDKGILRNVL